MFIQTLFLKPKLRRSLKITKITAPSAGSEYDKLSPDLFLQAAWNVNERFLGVIIVCKDTVSTLVWILCGVLI